MVLLVVSGVLFYFSRGRNVDNDVDEAYGILVEKYKNFKAQQQNKPEIVEPTQTTNGHKAIQKDVDVVYQKIFNKTVDLMDQSGFFSTKPTTTTTKKPEIIEPVKTQAPKPQETPKSPEVEKPVQAQTIAEAPKPVETPKSPEVTKPVEAQTIAEAPKPVEAPKSPEIAKLVEAHTIAGAPKPVETPKSPEVPKPVEALTIVEVPKPVEMPKSSEVPK